MYSSKFSEFIFNKCGLLHDPTDLEFLLSEDIGNLHDLPSNKIYKDIEESYELINENEFSWPFWKYKFTDSEIEFQKSISVFGNLNLYVCASRQGEQVWSIELMIPSTFYPSAVSEVITVIRTHQKLKPYEVSFHTEFDRVYTDDSFEKLSLLIFLKFSFD
jgi:hypothetical protein